MNTRVLGIVILPIDQPAHLWGEEVARELTEIVNGAEGNAYIYYVESDHYMERGFIVMTEPNQDEAAQQAFEKDRTDFYGD